MAEYVMLSLGGALAKELLTGQAEFDYYPEGWGKASREMAAEEEEAFTKWLVIRTKALLEAHRPHLHALAEALVEQKELDGSQVKAVIVETAKRLMAPE